MASDPKFDALDAQWRAFCKDLEESYREARELVRQAAKREPGTWGARLHLVRWTNGDPIEIGIELIGERRGGDPHAN